MVIGDLNVHVSLLVSPCGIERIQMELHNKNNDVLVHGVSAFAQTWKVSCGVVVLPILDEISWVHALQVRRSIQRVRLG